MNLRRLLASTVIAALPAASAFAQAVATNPPYGPTTTQGQPLYVGLAAVLFASVVGGVVYVAGRVLTPGGGAVSSVTSPPSLAGYSLVVSRLGTLLSVPFSALVS